MIEQQKKLSDLYQELMRNRIEFDRYFNVAAEKKLENLAFITANGEADLPPSVKLRPDIVQRFDSLKQEDFVKGMLKMCKRDAEIYHEIIELDYKRHLVDEAVAKLVLAFKKKLEEEIFAQQKISEQEQLVLEYLGKIKKTHDDFFSNPLHSPNDIWHLTDYYTMEPMKNLLSVLSKEADIAETSRKIDETLKRILSQLDTLETQ